MSEAICFNPEVTEVHLTEDEVSRARTGAQDFAKALEVAKLSQFFFLTKAEVSEKVQDIFIGDKPVFYDGEIVKAVGNLFPQDRFTVANEMIYDPILVRRILDNYPDIYQGVLPDLGMSSDEDLKNYFLGMSSVDSKKDLNYHTQLGLLLGIPKEDVEAGSKFISYRGELIQYMKNNVSAGNLDLRVVKMVYRYLNKEKISAEEMKVIEPILLTKIPPEFIDHPLKEKIVSFGAYDYTSVTNSGEEGKKHFEALREASGIKKYLSRENLLRVLANKIGKKASA